jgi:gluconolactonase
MMERALTFAGYEVNHSWGEGGHSGQHGTAIFPDVMRWLWKDYPTRVKAGKSRNQMLGEILADGQGWTQSIEPTGRPLPGPSVVGPNHETWFLSPDGKLNVIEANGKPRAKLSGIHGYDLVALHNGNLYITEPGSKGPGDPSKIWLITADGKKKLVDSGPFFATGVTASTDQTLLYVADGKSHWVYSYQIQADGSLTARQKYYWLHVPDDADDSGAGGMCTDRDGRLYVATRLGVQVCDQAGRVNCILPVPGGAPTGVWMGGADNKVLYARVGDTLMQRRLNAEGAELWGPPSKPAAPRL